MQKIALFAVAVLLFGAAGVLPASTYAQSPVSTLAAHNIAASSSLNTFDGISLSTSAAVHTRPLALLESSSNTLKLATPPAPAKGKSGKLPRLGVGVRIGTLGIAVEAATAVLRRANVRVGFNDFSYTLSGFSKDGINYKGTLALRSFEANFDYFLFSGFHVSPGVLLYNGNEVTATAAVPAGQTFTLGGTTYISDPSGANPVTGTGILPLNKTAPTLKFGFGNLLPRSHRHFSFSTEFGVAFQQSPKVGLALKGTACSASGGCVNAATDPTVQANIQSEEAKINKNLTVFRYYPILSMGFGWKF